MAIDPELVEQIARGKGPPDLRAPGRRIFDAASGRAYRKLFLIFLASALLLPLLEMATGFVRITPLDENRNREKWPVHSLFSNPSDYVAQARLWFDDHYGFRDLLIRLKAEIDYRVFRSSDRIYIGKRGWLYYRNVIDNEQPAEERMTDKDLQNAVSYLERLRDRLKRRGIKLVVVTNELKDRFYPEFLPDRARIAKTYHRFEVFRAQLRQVPGILYVDTTPVLLAAKARHDVFYKSDFHWNNPGAFEAAKVIVNTIGHDADVNADVWHYGLDIGHYNVAGPQATSIPIFHPPENEELSLKPSWPDPHRQEILNGDVYDLISKATPQSAPNLLPTVVDFGDSFSEGLSAAGIADYFQNYYRGRREQVKLENVLNSMPTDTKYFIYQFIEVKLPYLERADETGR